MIRLIYQADGDRTERSFRSLALARRYMLSKLGPAPQAFDAFGVITSDNGAIVPVNCTVRQLLGRKR